MIDYRDLIVGEADKTRRQCDPSGQPRGSRRTSTPAKRP